MAAAGAAEERASALIAKAEKKLNGMFSFGKGKYEEAAELYMQAAKQYQLAKNCTSPPPPPAKASGRRSIPSDSAPRPAPAPAVNQAAACYEKVVGFHNELGSVLEMAMAYKEAGSMYEKAEKPNGAPHDTSGFLAPVGTRTRALVPLPWPSWAARLRSRPLCALLHTLLLPIGLLRTPSLGPLPPHRVLPGARRGKESLRAGGTPVGVCQAG